MSAEKSAAPRGSARYEIPETLDAIEECYRRGWTDGLPVVPATEGKVEAMLAAAGLRPDHVLGEVPVRRRVLTAELLLTGGVQPRSARGGLNDRAEFTKGQKE